MSDISCSSERLGGAVEALVGEFAGVFAPETVERCVRESYHELAETATVATHLPLLAQRFARERLRAVRRTSSGGPAGVLFVCTHNAGRSQIAAAWLRTLAPDVQVWSAGTQPGGEVSPAVIEAMGEVGIDLSEAFAKPLTDEVIGAAEVVVTLGCGEACPVVPGRRYEDWTLAHSLGSSAASVRAARDEIRQRVESLIASLRSVVP